MPALRREPQPQPQPQPQPPTVLSRPWGHTETRDSAGPRGAGTETPSHCITRGNRNAITAPSSNNPALTSNVACNP
ncbi:hypothetical protein SVIOM342S_10245 [Streptomyces violaceorubidus]